MCTLVNLFYIYVSSDQIWVKHFKSKCIPFVFIANKIWSATMFEPNNTESKNSNQLFYPEWSIKPQPTMLEKFLNDQRKTADNPNYVDYL